MSKTRHLILWIFFGMTLFSAWVVSEIKPSFIYDSINTEQISEALQSIINSVEQVQDPRLLGVEEDLDYVIEESDSVVYWSTNKLKLEELQTIQKAGVYHLSSRIYWVWINQQNSRKIYYLVSLKKDFEFENEYLRNTSFDRVYFPPNYRPTSQTSDYKVSVDVAGVSYDLFFEKESPDKIVALWKYFIFLVFIFSIIGIGVLAYRVIQNSSIVPYGKIVIWLLLLFLIRWILVYQLPFIEDFYLFQAYDFANRYIPSLGMLIVNALWLYVLLLNTLRLWKKSLPQFNFIGSIIGQALAFILLLVLVYLMHDIIINSTSNFLDFDSVIMHYQDILLLLVFGIFILLFFKVLIFILHHTKDLSLRLFLKIGLFLYFPITDLFLFLEWHLSFLPVFVFASGLVISLKERPYFSQQTTRLILIFLGSLFVVSFVELTASKKELSNRYLRLANHQIEDNRLAEYLLNDLDQELLNDSVLLRLIYRLPETEQNIYDYIQMQYFTGFWSQYQGDITICASNNIFEEPNDINSCKLFFDKKMENASKMLGSSHFVAITDYGIDNYLGSYHFIKEIDSALIDLYILLKPKKQHKNLGYPSILLSKEIDKKDEPNYYSFAKYIDGKLVSHSGNYNYPLEYVFANTLESEDIVLENGYSHLIEQQNDKVYNVISVKEQTAWTFFVVLSYVFILYIGTFYFFEFLRVSIQLRFPLSSTLKDKLRISFLGLLVITFVVIAWSIISKSTDLSEQKQKNVLDEKMQSVLIELKHKLSQSDDFSKLDVDYLNYLLTKFSNVFFTDINLYDLSGRLIASSRPEVFKKGLIGNCMNPEAFVHIAREKRSKYIHNERIGTQEYLSAYVPFKNIKNKSVAYLNLPYFAKDKEIKSDITSFVIAFLNIFVLLFLITGLFTIFISNRITLPLVIIQQKLKDFSVGKKNESIVYKSDDEIGALVSEYNKTVLELNKNIELLAQKEREGAWKEMAKQIAHEIKNPLTPMKLSIQHLKKIWKDDHPNKDQKINETVDLIVKQIDNLAEIASAFSDFSRMTIAKQNTFDLLKLIDEQISLYSEEAKINLVYDKQSEFVLFADEQQLSRAFQNILSNAIQAVSEDKEPQIEITIRAEDQHIKIQICDNGTGMNEETQERLFEPNFTTKNSGMGLGLAIVKQIVENNSGAISFETKVDKGTCFKLSFNKA